MPYDETEKLLNEREKTHGDADKTFALAAELINTMFPIGNIQKHQFALVEIQHKISRIINGSYHEDHWNDIEGYARLGRELQEKDSDRSN
jgi:hypothetical protein